MSICTNAWESQADIKARTGLKLDDINREIRREMANKTCECRLEGDDTLMIPYFRIRSTQG